MEERGGTKKASRTSPARHSTPCPAAMPAPVTGITVAPRRRVAPRIPAAGAVAGAALSPLVARAPTLRRARVQLMRCGSVSITTHGTPPTDTAVFGPVAPDLLVLNPDPSMITVEPPAGEPAAGVTDVTAARYSNM